MSRVSRTGGTKRRFSDGVLNLLLCLIVDELKKAFFTDPTMAVCCVTFSLFGFVRIAESPPANFAMIMRPAILNELSALRIILLPPIVRHLSSGNQSGPGFPFLACPLPVPHLFNGFPNIFILPHFTVYFYRLPTHFFISHNGRNELPEAEQGVATRATRSAPIYGHVQPF